MATAKSGLKWSIEIDDQLVPNLSKYSARVIQAMEDLANFFAAKIEAYAKSHAPWTDRTGAARAGLRTFVRTTALTITIFLVHSVFYGKFLELGTVHMRPYPIIMPALQAHYGPIMDAARKLVA